MLFVSSFIPRINSRTMFEMRYNRAEIWMIHVPRFHIAHGFNRGHG